MSLCEKLYKTWTAAFNWKSSWAMGIKIASTSDTVEASVRPWKIDRSFCLASNRGLISSTIYTVLLSGKGEGRPNCTRSSMCFFMSFTPSLTTSRSSWQVIVAELQLRTSFTLFAAIILSLIPAADNVSSDVSYSFFSSS